MNTQNQLTDKRLTIIGAGKMGGTLLRALVRDGAMPAEQIVATTGHSKTAEALREGVGAPITTGTNNAEAVRGADIIIIAVKPQRMADILESIAGQVNPGQLVITVAAAVKTDALEEKLADVAVIRCMPNTPCLVNEGMSVLCPGRHASESDIEIARAIFSAVGRVALLDNEKLMDAVTGLSGSGPAYVYIMIEALAEGGVKVGLPRDLATTLAAQSLLGAAAMVLETGEHPAKLKDEVTTPAGTTVDGLMELEDGGLRVALIKAVESATLKSKEIEV